MKLLTGNSNKNLSQKISKFLKTKLVHSSIRKFSDGEIYIEINENIRGNSIFLLQSVSSPANDNLMELLLCIDALKRSSAKNITAVIPYFGYARQDRKSGPRTPISAKLVANLITVAGADRVLTIDLHAAQIQGFFDIPTDNLFAVPVFIENILQNYNPKDLCIIAPDVGGVLRARAIAKRLNTDLAIIDKRREAPGQSEVMNIIGEVKNRHCLLVDDIVDSGGTLCNAAETLIDSGAITVDAYVTHGVLSGGAVARVASSPLNSLVTTDSIAATEAFRVAKNLKHISISPLLGEAVKRIHMERSVSSLFD